MIPWGVTNNLLSLMPQKPLSHLWVEPGWALEGAESSDDESWRSSTCSYDPRDDEAHSSLFKNAQSGKGAIPTLLSQCSPGNFWSSCIMLSLMRKMGRTTGRKVMSAPKHSQADGRSHRVIAVEKEEVSGQRAGWSSLMNKAIAKRRCEVTRSTWRDGSSDGEEEPNMTRNKGKFDHVFI